MTGAGDEPSEDAGVAAPMPMFPLGSVLFPNMLLPLHIFEPRYQALVKDCLRHGQEFGVVLIERGAEVGGGDTRFRVGTVAHIREAAELGGGRWAVVAVGTRRLRIRSWLPDDPYPVALVEDLAEVRLPPAAGMARSALVEAETAVRRALALAAEVGEAPVPSTFALVADPDVAVWQLAASAPLGPVDQLRVLEVDDPVQRLLLIAALAGEASQVLAYRLSGGATGP